MKLLLHRSLTVILFLFLAANTRAQSIFSNPITDVNPSAGNPYVTNQVVTANIGASGIGRGSGITAVSTTNTYNASGWNSVAFDANDYYTFTLTPNSGFEIDFASFVYTSQVVSGPTNFAFRSSLDNYTADIGAPTSTGTTVSLAAFQNITSAVTFRIYAWGASAPAGTFGINDFTFNGTVNAAATLTANLQDSSASGLTTAAIGETITYKNTITNTSGNAATGLTVTNTAPANTTFTAGSQKTSALARDDSYSTGYSTYAAPVSLNISTVATGVNNNDFGLPSISVVSFGTIAGPATAAGSAGTTNGGGTLTVNANGTFTYTPLSGFSGVDQFKYIATTGAAGLPNDSAIVSITVGVAAAATADNYTATGNVFINQNVLFNDNTAASGAMVTAVNGVTGNVGNTFNTPSGATVTLLSNGDLTYNPPPGVEGADNFNYTINNGFTTPSTSNVTVTISGMIWFINNASAAAVEDGRLTTPFKTLTAFAAINNGSGNNPAAGDNIFLYESATAYTGSTVLLANQKFIGQDASSTLPTITGLTPPAGSGSLPAMNIAGDAVTINGSGANIITLNTGNTIRGLTLNNAPGFRKILGNNFGTLTLGNTAFPDVILSGTGGALDLSTGTLAGGLTSLTTTSSPSQGINLNAVAGTYNFGNTNIGGTTTQGILISGSSTISPTFGTTTVSSATDGVSIQNNSSNVTFASLAITTTNGVGLQGINNSGQIVVTNNAGAINATGGAAISLSAAVGSTVNLNFASVTSTNATNGVTLTNISGTINAGAGALTSTGTVFNVNGGSANLTYVGTISQANAQRVVNVTNATGGILTFSGSVTGTAGNTGINLATNTGAVISFTGGVNLNGTATIFSATGGGTLSVTGATNNIGNSVSPTGTALNLGNIIVGAGGLLFQNVSANGGTNGVSITTVSGGAISIGTTSVNNSTGSGVFVSGSGSSVSFGNTVVTSAGDGVDLTNNASGTRSFGTLVITVPGNSIAFKHSAAGGMVSVTGATTINNNNAGAGAGISISGSTSPVTFAAATINKQGTGAAILLNTTSGTNAGSVNFNSVIAGTNATRLTGRGIDITGTGIVNPVYDFGATSIFTNASAGIISSAFDGTINIASGTVDVISNGAIFITGPAGLTTLGVNLATVNANGGTNSVSLTNTTGAAILGTGALSGASTTAFNMSGGNTTITYNGTISQITNGQRAINIANTTGGTITFNGAISSTSTSTGINIATNPGAIINFTAPITLDGATSVFSATGGGTISAPATTNTIGATTPPTGTSLNISNTTIGAAGVTFQKISSAAGAGNGIILVSTGSGSFTVLGTGTAASGGTISGKTGADGSSATQGTGIYLSNCNNISLSRMNIQGCQNYGIRGLTVNTFTLSNSTIGTTTKNGTSVSADPETATLTGGEGSIRFFDLTGTSSIIGCSLDNGYARTVFIRNNAAATLNLAISSSTLNQNLNNSNGGDPGGNSTDALYIQSTGTSVVNLTVTGCTFSAYRQFGILTDARNTARMDITVTTSNFSNSNTGNANASAAINIGGDGDITTGGDGFVKYNINGCTFRHGSGGSAPNNGGAQIVSGGVSGKMTMYGKILNNTIGVTGIPFSGAGNAADALRLFQSGSNGSNGNTRYLVQGNTIQRYGEAGIQLNSRQSGAASSSGPGGIDATILGNTIREPGTAALGAFAAIWVNAGALPPDNNTVNVAIGGTNAAHKNTMQDSDPSNATDVFLDANSCGGCPSKVNLYRNGSVAGGANNEDITRNILVEDNVPTLNLLAGFTNATTIGFVNGLPAQPPLRLAPGTPKNDVNLKLVHTSEGKVSDAQIKKVHAAALVIWKAAGLDSTSLNLLKRTVIKIGKLEKQELGKNIWNEIIISPDAAGNGWHKELKEPIKNIAAAGHNFSGQKVDLLTCILHEMGHIIGLQDLNERKFETDLMYSQLELGKRKLPNKQTVERLLPKDMPTK